MKSFPDIIFVDFVDSDPVFAKYLQVYYVKTGKSRYICAMCKFVLHKNMTFRTNLRSAIGFVSKTTNGRNLLLALVESDPIFAKYWQLYYVKTRKSRFVYLHSLCKFWHFMDTIFRTNL